MNPLTILLGIIKNLSPKAKLYGSIVIIILLLIGLIMFQSHQINSLKTKLITSNQNVVSLADTIRTIKTKSGQEETVKYALLVNNIKELQKINAALAKKVKDQPGEVHAISDISVAANHDTIKINVPVIKHDSGIYTMSAAYADSNKGGSLSLAAKIKLRIPGDSAQIVLDRLQMNLNIECGLSVVDKKLQAFAKCDYPGVKFTSINSASFDVPVLVKPPSRFWLGCKCFGLGVGIGLVAVPVYKLFNK
jgi:hypothetical protein